MPYNSGKYDCARDEFLDLMTRGSWSNKSSGDVESPAGWFALVVNEPNEIAEIRSAFWDDLERLGVSDSDITGFFVVNENGQGFVTVHKFDSRNAAESMYAEFKREFWRWLGDE